MGFSGPMSFVQDGLMDFCHGLLDLNLKVPVSESAALALPAKPLEVTGPTSKMSVSDIAVKTSSKSGSDLVMCAAASLTFSKGQEVFKRADLLTEMKSAKAFYRQTYSNNLSKALDTLVKSGRLSALGNETFALPHSERESISQQLS